MLVKTTLEAETQHALRKPWMDVFDGPSGDRTLRDDLRRLDRAVPAAFERVDPADRR